jgi:hypothetical protein
MSVQKYFKFEAYTDEVPSLTRSLTFERVPLGYYYTREGEFLEHNELGPYYSSTSVYIIDKETYNDKIKNKTFIIYTYDFIEIEKLEIDYKLMIAFAAVVNLESGGKIEESYVIANVVMNFLKSGGSSSLKKLEDIVMYKNSFMRGSTQDNYTNFRCLTPVEQNKKYAIGAVVNAIGCYNNRQEYSDVSEGANSWDGIDLISTKYDNPHRNYTWSEDSKTLLKQYKKERNGGIDVDMWTYKKTDYEIKATKIVGKTLFTYLITGRGERKSNNTVFQ